MIFTYVGNPTYPLKKPGKNAPAVGIQETPGQTVLFPESGRLVPEIFFRF